MGAETGGGNHFDVVQTMTDEPETLAAVDEAGQTEYNTAEVKGAIVTEPESARCTNPDCKWC